MRVSVSVSVSVRPIILPPANPCCVGLACRAKEDEREAKGEVEAAQVAHHALDGLVRGDNLDCRHDQPRDDHAQHEGRDCFAEADKVDDLLPILYRVAVGGSIQPQPGRWREMREDGGRWWEMAGDGGRWWEMAGDGEIFWEMVGDGGDVGRW